jgi:hypothetical protein
MASVVSFTERAADVLRAAASAAARFGQDAFIRVRRQGDGVTFELAEGPQPGDSIVEQEDFSLLVEAGLEGVVDAGDHGVLTLKEPG